MSVRRREGFTLIELLVVIAIIAILAAMLFPVFARARESARKIQCLANVKNIATAVQMYLTDYDRFWPGQHDTTMLEALSGVTGLTWCTRFPNAAMSYGANPWLRPQVILDEYVRNRDVWRCPSSQHGARDKWIFPHYTPVWWHYYLDNAGRWGRNDPDCSGGPCCPAWPPGWGGTVTDSIAQRKRATEEDGVFAMSISMTDMMDRKTSEISDAAWLVVCGDTVGQGPWFEQVFGAAYGSNPCCCWGLDSDDACRFMFEVSFRKKYAPHMGGLNMGFADGHASWWDAEAAVSQSDRCTKCYEAEGACATAQGKLNGLCPQVEM